MGVIRLLAGGEFIDTPGIRRLGASGKGAAKRDDTAHLIGQDLGELAGIEAPRLQPTRLTLRPCSRAMVSTFSIMPS